MGTDGGAPDRETSGKRRLHRPALPRERRAALFVATRPGSVGRRDIASDGPPVFLHGTYSTLWGIHRPARHTKPIDRPARMHQNAREEVREELETWKIKTDVPTDVPQRPVAR